MDTTYARGVLDVSQGEALARTRKNPYHCVMDLQRVLGASELFGGMGGRSLERLLAMGRQKDYARGDILFMEGTPGNEFFLLLEGEVRLYKTTPGGQDVSLRIVRPAEVFAEVILFEEHAYPVNAQALGPVRVFAVPRDGFLELMDEKAFRDEFIAMLMRRQRYLAGRILYLAGFDVEERFFRFLIEHYGTGPVYRVDMAKKDLAAAIGTIPETLSRLVNRLKD
ncbi:MAG TPA: Crp/Fnr family transcriptional regulator, partial [Deltaproteobacteria bacterium]|nr:Crp/Fnr family transcriptional regulator [Deltaproteobacteria bacterium]